MWLKHDKIVPTGTLSKLHFPDILPVGVTRAADTGFQCLDPEPPLLLPSGHSQLSKSSG